MMRLLRHRLLNIVSGVKSANSLLANELDDRLTDREREYFPLINKECDQICFVMERMELFFGALPTPAPVPLKGAISQIMQDLHIRHPMAEIELQLDLADAERLVCPAVLGTVLNEAVDNAYGISRTRVTISVRDGDGCSVVRVADCGKQLPEEVLKMAFEPFFSERTRHMGIGLSIARRMVENQRGSVAIGNGHEGPFVEFNLPVIGA